jgi:mannose/fructose/N-acetylgalactosamine-specific phosphotransferase system component IIC
VDWSGVASVLPPLAARSAGVAALGAVLGLDYIVIGQTLIAQPAISGPIVGIVLGEPMLGIWAGLTVQLLWAGRLPVGEYVPPNSCVAVVFTVGAAALMSGSAPLVYRAVLAGLLTLPVAYVAGRLDVLIKARLNVAYLHSAERALARGGPAPLGVATLKGVASVYVKDFALLWASVFAAAALLSPVASRVTGKVAGGLELAYVVLPVAGIALLLNAYWSWKTVSAFTVGAAAVGFTLFAASIHLF